MRKRSRSAQDTLAEASAFASESIGAIRTVQAFNGGPTASGRYSDAIEGAFGAAQAAIRSRSILTGVAISMVFGSIAGVLWYGAHAVLDGTMSAGTLGQFVLYAVVAASSLGALSEVWGEIAQASGAAERLSELLAEVPAIRAPANPKRFPATAAGAIAFNDVRFAYPSAPERSALKGLTFRSSPARPLPSSAPPGPARARCFR